MLTQFDKICYNDKVEIVHPFTQKFHKKCL